MAIFGKDGLAMRLTFPARMRSLALLTASVAMIASAGCQRVPYIDQSKSAPRDDVGARAEEDAQVTKASFTSQLPLPLPKLTKPRTTNDPEAREVWPMTLQEAIKIGLDNSEVVRVIPLGAQGIPVGGFEPSPLNTGVGTSGVLGSGALATVYDPAIQETQIAQALSVFDANLSTTLFWGKSETPFNNGIQAGQFGGPKFPVIFIQDTLQLQSTIQKRAATGSVLQVQYNANYAYTNSTSNTYPGAWTTNTQLSITQPLLGGTAQNLSGLEANRAGIVIARINADSAVWKFKAAIMEHVRSIEQQYWALSQQTVQLWSREVAVDLGQEILRREQAELEVGRGTIANVAEASQQLERFRLDLVTATNDLINTERQLRNILGLPPADNRRIIPVTAPQESRFEPDWESSLAQMLAFQPDIVNQQLLVRLAELQLLVARNQLLPVLNLQALYQFNGLGQHLDKANAVMTGSTLFAIDPRTSLAQRTAGINGGGMPLKNFQQYQLGLTFQMPLGFRGPLANTRQAQYVLLKNRANLNQIVHQTTHSLARFFQEVDANYKQFKIARRFREAAAQRLDAQKAFYDEGKITIDRYLDAVSQYATAVAQEAQFKTSYNTSIAALEEAKGTLLAYNNIAVAEGPYPKRAYVQAKDQQEAHKQLLIRPDGPLHPEPNTGASHVPDPVVPMAPEDGDNSPIVLPPLPAPVGPVGPRSSPGTPVVPAGESNFSISQTRPRPAVLDPSLVNTSAAPKPVASEPGILDAKMTLPPLPPE